VEQHRKKDKAFPESFAPKNKWLSIMFYTLFNVGLRGIFFEGVQTSPCCHDNLIPGFLQTSETESGSPIFSPLNPPPQTISTSEQ